MNLDPDDPRWTAYALGELDDITRAQVEAALARDPEASRLVEEIRATALALEAEFSAELLRDSHIGLGEDRREALIAQSAQLVHASPSQAPGDSADMDEHLSKTPLYHVLTHPAHRRRESSRLIAIAGIAAALLVALGSIATLLTNHPRPSVAQTQPAPARDVVPFVIFPGNTGSPGASALAEANLAWDPASDAKDFIEAREHPTSGFPMGVATASYADLRRSIAAGRLPARDAVRIEEMVNAFAYHYPAAQGDAVFAADIEVAACPWESGHRLVRIGLKARESADGSHAPVARDATARVEFNPMQVTRYRLIGYDRHEEKGMGKGSGLGSDVAPGQAVTALYEVIPAPSPTTAPSSEAAHLPMLALRLHYRLPGVADALSQQFAGIDTGRSLPQASADFQFAAAVASFGRILRESPQRDASSFNAPLALAEGARGKDEDGSRTAFVDLVKKARELKRA